MTYKTHREFAVCFVIISNFIVYKYTLSDTSYYINLMVLLLFGKQGALFPDYDHIWKNVKEKTIISWVINKAIHITGGRHRSWQTHSWDIWCVTFIAILYINFNFLNTADRTVMILIILGFWSGWFSHLFSDMLSSGGVRLFSIKKKTIAFVPKQANMKKNVASSIIVILLGIGLLILQLEKYKVIACVIVVIGVVLLKFSVKMKNIRFNTGNEWEDLVYKMTVTLNGIFMTVALIFPLAMKVIQSMNIKI